MRLLQTRILLFLVLYPLALVQYIEYLVQCNSTLYIAMCLPGSDELNQQAQYRINYLEDWEFLPLQL